MERPVVFKMTALEPNKHRFICMKSGLQWIQICEVRGQIKQQEIWLIVSKLQEINGEKKLLVEDGIVVAAGKAWMPASFSSLGILYKHGTFPFPGYVDSAISSFSAQCSVIDDLAM